MLPPCVAIRSTAPRARHFSPCSSIANNATLSDEDPALSAKTNIESPCCPRPVTDLGHVLEILGHVRTMPIEHLPALLGELARVRKLPSRASNGVHADVVTTGLVEYDHVERRRGRPFLLVAAHVESRRVGARMEELVHRRRVAVERKDHVCVLREELDEAIVGDAVRMLARGE